ncbi:MAG: caspase family protein [Planctomycetes bacterium]|nr:caspase family protein [Planctomycetota bacterium]
MVIPKTNCPKCNVRFSSPKGFTVGQAIKCPKCGTNFAVASSVATVPQHATPTRRAAATVGTPPQRKTPAPAPAQPALLSLDDDEPTPAKRSPIRFILLGVVFVLIAAAGFFVMTKDSHDPKQTASDDHSTDPHGTNDHDQGEKPPHVEPPKPAPPIIGPFPRRLLFIHISKYMTLNPLTNAPAGAPDRSKAAAQAMALHWKVPADKSNNQLYLLSDAVPPPEGRLMVKDVVRDAYEKFFESSRGQDRIVVYFGGHAVEIGGKAYLATIESDFDDVSSLLPLADFYDKLKACKATEKVVIWDVCRFNPQRGRPRPGSEPMSPGLVRMLTTAPPDVEVVTTCQSGENALESSEPGRAGSLFLEAFEASPSAKPPVQTEPIAVSELSGAIGKRVTEMAKAASSGTQTVKVTGKPKSKPTAFDANESTPKRFEFINPPKSDPSAEIKALIREFGVPPIKVDNAELNLAEFPYRADALKDYKEDVKIEDILKNKDKYKFRVAVIEAFDEIRNLWKSSGKNASLQIRETLPAPITVALKKQIKNEQNVWAFAIARLETVNDKLDALGKERNAQPKRWQAHYDYARAIIKARLAYMNECDLMLGNVLTETLPELNAKLGQTSYKLVSTETAKMKSKKEVKQLAAEAMDIFEKLIAERKGTPWAIQADRDMSFALGLAWQPNSTK